MVKIIQSPRFIWKSYSDEIPSYTKILVIELGYVSEPIKIPEGIEEVFIYENNHKNDYIFPQSIIKIINQGSFNLRTDFSRLVNLKILISK